VFDGKPSLPVEDIGVQVQTLSTFTLVNFCRIVWVGEILLVEIIGTDLFVLFADLDTKPLGIRVVLVEHEAQLSLFL
jgi:hypothetical protein